MTSPSEVEGRQLYYSAEVDEPDAGECRTYKMPDLVLDDSDKANLVSSKVDGVWHMPVIDIDKIPVKVVPSTTEGNCHLYIDKKMTWRQYKNLLQSLYECGIIEGGYYSAALAESMTFVHKPGHKKVFGSRSAYESPGD